MSFLRANCKGFRAGLPWLRDKKLALSYRKTDDSMHNTIISMYSLKDKEGTLINNIREDWFSDYDCRKLIGNIDFSVAIRHDGKELFTDTEYLLWAEAKQGNKHNIYNSFIQLILTIGRERTIEKYLPPKFLGAFDAEKIAFIPYNAIMEVFSQNDFNWNVTPSDHESKEFKQLKELVRRELDTSGKERDNVYVFYFDNHKKELRDFIKKNFVSGRDKIQRIRVNHNNFKAIYERWRQEVKPTIAVDWENVKKSGLLDADFYLADLLAENNRTLLDNLNVLLKEKHYEVDRKLDTDGLWLFKEVLFRDGMQAHTTFWCKYARPPKREYWDKIVERRDLLVPQDIRERKGSYFTPAIWVQKSQEYLENVLGENWQDEYYIWDCCAGTGNLLAGLTNKYNIWASTLDKADVDVMHQRIEQMGTGSNLLKSHVFQFDFLNDDFSRLPHGLQEIINDEDKRKKLVIYINPPYAEATSANTITGSGHNKSKVSIENATYIKYRRQIGAASNELFAQFFIRIYSEIPSCILAEFSTLKILQAANFSDFRTIFKAKLLKAFAVPAKTFDNVKGSFPIGFLIWNTNKTFESDNCYNPILTKLPFNNHSIELYDSKGNYIGQKLLFSISANQMLNRWIDSFKNTKDKTPIGYLPSSPSDFQHQNQLAILSVPQKRYCYPISKTNFHLFSIYFSVRHCIEATWLNDRDQFLYPNNDWKEDKDFQSDCLVYTLFHGQNRITSTQGINYWIPFTEQEVDAPDNFKSHFMSDFIAGKLSSKAADTIIETSDSLIPSQPIEFTSAATDVMEAGRKIWYYYLHHTTKVYGASPINVNASFYDIRAYFQGRDEKGKMNNTSTDEEYMSMLRDLRKKQKILAKQIEEKVYEYGFLK